MKYEKGITLIALIITIIVMLILVMVTVAFAMNGGLFEKAKIASDKTQVEIDKETLLFEVIGSTDKNGNMDIETMKQNAEEAGFTVEGAEFPFSFISEKGTEILIFENGTEIAIDTKNTDYIKEYLKVRNIDDNVSDDTLNKINEVVKRFTSYEANGTTYKLTKGEVLNFFTVLKDIDGQEHICYVYRPIFWGTYDQELDQEGINIKGEESYNRRVAIINYLNEQEEIAGMLRGDMNENYKIDGYVGEDDEVYSEDVDIMLLEATNSDEIPNIKLPEGVIINNARDFSINYYNIIGKCTNSTTIVGPSDYGTLKRFILGTNYANRITQKYDIESSSFEEYIIEF